MQTHLPHQALDGAPRCDNPFPKQLPPATNREAWFAAGTEAYKTYIRTLLSITDNIVAGEVVPPADTLRPDGDDPYFVVAADKGTATFSDTANGLAQVDEVGTLESRRNLGYASAAVSSAADTAAGEGCDPVFLLTDAGDWPQTWYRRLGFSPIGSIYEFLKLPLGSVRP